MKTGYPRKVLEEFEARIEKKLKEEQKLFDEAQANLKEAQEESEGLNGLDRLKCLEQKEKAAEMMQRSQQVIKLCRKALTRIAAGTYGICRRSGNLISLERLRRSPLTDESILAKIETGSIARRQQVRV